MISIIWAGKGKQGVEKHCKGAEQGDRHVAIESEACAGRSQKGSVIEPRLSPYQVICIHNFIIRIES